MDVNKDNSNQSTDILTAKESHAASQAVQVIAVASGKGGVGKTNVSVNLAAACANRGRAVMLMDADLGLGNVDVVLGLNPVYNLSHVLEGTQQLKDILIEGPSGITIVPAASGVKRMADLTVAENAGLVQAFSELSRPVDILFIDTAAGINDSVVTFTRAANEVIVVLCDEPASLTDAYALIKVLNTQHNIERFRIITNMVQSAAHANEVYKKLLGVCSRFLDVNLYHAGYIPFDDYLRRAVQKRWMTVNAFPRSRAAQAFMRLAEDLEDWTETKTNGHLSFFFERLINAQADQQKPEAIIDIAS